DLTAKLEGDDVVLNGVKTMVPNAAECELFVIAVELDGVNTFVIVESGTEGLEVESDPSMGLRAAALGRVVLKDVRVPAANLLGGANLSDTDRTEQYAEIVRRSRLAGPHWLPAPARPSSSTPRSTSTSVRHSASRSPTASQWPSWSPTSASSSTACA